MADYNLGIAPLQTDTWQHLIYNIRTNFSGSVTAVDYYVNGIYQGSSTQTHNIKPNNPYGYIIGSFDGTLADTFIGNMDDLRIYNTELTNEQINFIADPTNIGQIPEPHTTTLIALTAVCALVRRKRSPQAA